MEVLTQDYTISYIPSASYIARMQKKREVVPSILAVGDPIYEVKKEALSENRASKLGVYVTLVLPNGNADKAEIKSGDVFSVTVI